jgi:hypothetical protein
MTAGRSINSQNQDWGTPIKYVNAVKEVFGGKITLDPCSSPYSIVNAKVEYMPPEHDGLKETWNYPTIYVNPPYGINKKNRTTIRHWLAKCAKANEMYGSEVLALVPVATNTSHWKKYVFGRATAICFLYDTRLKFLVKGREGGKGAPMACAMIYWGENYQKFYEVFMEYGAVVDSRHLKSEIIGIERKKRQQMLFEKW